MAFTANGWSGDGYCIWGTDIHQHCGRGDGHARNEARLLVGSHHGFREISAFWSTSVGSVRLPGCATRRDPIGQPMARGFVTPRVEAGDAVGDENTSRCHHEPRAPGRLRMAARTSRRLARPRERGERSMRNALLFPRSAAEERWPVCAVMHVRTLHVFGAGVRRTRHPRAAQLEALEPEPRSCRATRSARRHSSTMRRRRTARQFPSTRTLAVRTYRLETFPTERAARAAGAQVTHRGRCGACSSFQDLAAYIERRDLNRAGRLCGLGGTFGSKTQLRCLSKLGFTEACAQIWSFNIDDTRSKCMGICTKTLPTKHKLPDGSLTHASRATKRIAVQRSRRSPVEPAGVQACPLRLLGPASMRKVRPQCTRSNTTTSVHALPDTESEAHGR